MSSPIERGWRVVATGLAFGSFGVGGVVLGLTYFPLLQLVVRDKARRTRQARLTIHRTFRLFVGLMKALGLLRYRIEGQEKLQRPGLLILANHPTLIDVVFLISLVPNADCVVKASLARNPFTRGPIRATDYICNDSGAGLIDDCIASLKSGNSLIIFPEGTRTPLAGEMILRRGAANIAVRSGCDITPVAIACDPVSLTKGAPWWKVPPRRMHFYLEVRDDIPVAHFLRDAGGEAPVAARRLTEFLQGYFSTESPTHAGA